MDNTNEVTQAPTVESDKLLILIADDSRLLRKKLHEELARHGCEVIEAVNGKEAITFVLENELDGVILDIVMPIVGGIEALQFIREFSPDLPVVMLSSMNTPQKLMKCLKMGAIDFIQKPYTREQIARTVERIRKLKAKRQTAAAEADESDDFSDIDEL